MQTICVPTAGLTDAQAEPVSRISPELRQGSARQALVLVPPQPPVHRSARYVEAPRYLHHLDTIADHREYRLIPLFQDTQLYQHVRECVADQAGQRHPSGEAVLPIRRGRCVRRQAEPNNTCVPPAVCPGRNRTCDTRFR
jgi:hypothetical protein